MQFARPKAAHSDWCEALTLLGVECSKRATFDYSGFGLCGIHNSIAARADLPDAPRSGNKKRSGKIKKMEDRISRLECSRVAVLLFVRENPGDRVMKDAMKQINKDIRELKRKLVADAGV